jgi:uncharacterized protein YecE (DUF72 family)
MEDIKMGKIRFGTSGYHYKDWIGNFYPGDIKAKDFLTYYSTKFNCVEINNTFYRMPSAHSMKSMSEKVNSDFKFSIKATKTLTHEIDSNWKNEATQFQTAMEPLLKNNSLSSVLFQFPQSFHYTPDNRIYLSNLLNEFKSIPCVVEFRRKDWQLERVYSSLDKREVGICLVDMPSLKNLPTFLPLVTGKNAYVRFHGRNDQTWYESSGVNGSNRYRYLYSESELKEPLPAIKVLKDKADLTQIFFNNHPEGAAAFNAKMLSILLS